LPTRNASGSTASRPRSPGTISSPISPSPAPIVTRSPGTASAANRLGFALQPGALRYLGFSPDNPSTAPEAVVAFVAKQLDVAPDELQRYGQRGQTRTEQLRAEGRTVDEEDITRLSPARYEHINPYGKYRFEVEEGLSRFRLRPLRQPSEQKFR
jgi:rRNA maturation protein Nop10